VPGEEAIACFASFGAQPASLADVLRHGHGLDPVRAWRAIMRVGEGLVRAGHAHLAEQPYNVAACQPIATTGCVREAGGTALLTSIVVFLAAGLS